MPHARPVPAAMTGRQVATARWVLMGLFALTGLMVSSWLTRLPSVRDALGMSPSDLGAVLFAGAVGALLTVTVAGAVVTRWGGRVALVVSAIAFTVAYLLLGLAPTVGSVPLLAAGVFLKSAGFALGNVPLNVESAGLERRLGRTVLPQFHAAFSIGAVLGSLLGAAMAQLGVSVLVQFGGTAVLALVCRLAAIPHVVLDTLPAREVAARAAASGDGSAVPPVRTGGGLRAAFGAWRERRTVLIGLVIMSAALSEGSANDWLALAVVDGFAQPEAVGAVVFGLFVGAMTVVRLLGTRLIDRYGRVAVLRASGLVSLTGLVLFGFGPNLTVAGVGVVAWGLGAALAVPIGLAAASEDPLRAAGRVAVVSAFASFAHLAAPPLLGLAAESMGARRALLLITGAMVVSVLLSGQVARRPQVGAGVPTRPAPARPAPVTEPDPARAAAALLVEDTGPVPVVAAPSSDAPSVPAPRRAPAAREHVAGAPPELRAGVAAGG